MIPTGNATSMDLIEAAAFLGLHPNTLQERAKAGQVPGCKVGREWRFLDLDLMEYIREQYPANKPGEKERKPCRLLRGAKSGGLTSMSVEAALDKALNRKTDRKPSESTTKFALVRGKKPTPAKP